MATSPTNILKGAKLFDDIYLIIVLRPLFRKDRSEARNRNGQRLKSHRIGTIYRNKAFIKLDYYCQFRTQDQNQSNEVYLKINRMLFLDDSVPNDGLDFIRNNQIMAGYHLFMKEIVDKNTGERYCNIQCTYKTKILHSDNEYLVSCISDITDVIPRHEFRSDDIVYGLRIIINKFNRERRGHRTQSRFGPNNGYGGVFQLTQNNRLSIREMRGFMTMPEYFGIYLNPNARLILKKQCAIWFRSVKDDEENIDFYKYADKQQKLLHHERTLFLGGTYIFVEGLLGFTFPQRSQIIYRLADAEADIRAAVDNNDIRIDCQNEYRFWVFLNEIKSDFNTVCWGLFDLIDQNDIIKYNSTDETEWCLSIPENAKINKITSISEGMTETKNLLRNRNITQSYELTKLIQSQASASTSAVQSTSQRAGAQHIRPQSFASQQTNPRHQSRTHRQSFRSNTPHSQQHTYQPSVSTPQHIRPQLNISQQPNPRYQSQTHHQQQQPKTAQSMGMSSGTQPPQRSTYASAASKPSPTIAHHTTQPQPQRSQTQPKQQRAQQPQSSVTPTQSQYSQSTAQQQRYAIHFQTEVQAVQQINHRYVVWAARNDYYQRVGDNQYILIGKFTDIFPVGSTHTREKDRNLGIYVIRITIKRGNQSREELVPEVTLLKPV